LSARNYDTCGPLPQADGGRGMDGKHGLLEFGRS
jgi:hypothetical protein